MKIRSLVTLVALSAASTFWPAATALADSPASDAAQTCLQGPQIDYYEIVGTTEDAAPVLDFGDLIHGSDETGPYVIATNHGDCVSFIAKNNGPGVKTPSPKIVITIRIPNIHIR